MTQTFNKYDRHSENGIALLIAISLPFCIITRRIGAQA